MPPNYLFMVSLIVCRRTLAPVISLSNGVAFVLENVSVAPPQQSTPLIEGNAFRKNNKVCMSTTIITHTMTILKEVCQ